MASEDDGYDDGGDGDAYDYDDGDVYGYDDVYVYEENGDGDYGLDFVGNDENLPEDITSNQGNHEDYRNPNHDYDDDDDEDDHDDVVDSDSDDSGVIAFDSRYDLWCISQQMEKIYFEHNGALNENPGGAGVGPVLKSESLGNITHNTAEYKAVSQGAVTDLHMGYGSICGHWDSQLLTPQGADRGDYYDHDPRYDYGYNNVVDNELCDDTYITREMTDSSSDLEDITQQMEKVHLECDGASNGNSGRASTGAVLKYEIGRVIAREYEGLGKDTNNAAEYRALNPGTRATLDMGYKYGNSTVEVILELGGWILKLIPRISQRIHLRVLGVVKSETVYLEFDGASKGNPGRAGAGALLKSEDGTVITRVREGLGEGTNNDAEYRSLIQGLKTVLLIWAMTRSMQRGIPNSLLSR